MAKDIIALYPYDMIYIIIVDIINFCNIMLVSAIFGDISILYTDAALADIVVQYVLLLQMMWDSLTLLQNHGYAS